MSSNPDLSPKDGPCSSGTKFKTACIIVDKVYFQCQQRECFEDVKVRVPHGCVPNFEFLDIVFNPGEIVRGTLVVTDTSYGPYFKRVRFKVKITFTVRIKNTATGTVESISGELPLIQKDIILYLPEARDEFTFKIVVETLSESLTEPVPDRGVLIFTIGVFMITKVVGKVQLLVPEYGFCPAPPECEKFQPDQICDDFECAEFPDFFPAQSCAPWEPDGEDE
ncbi:MAG: hypothetical protein ACOCG5_01940 [Candidatus Alkaliphilus sp. MAG34]